MSQVTTTNKQLYIVETVSPFSSIDIQFVPYEINNPRDAKLQNVTIVGRNDELMHYITGNEKLSLNLDFYAPHDNVKEVNDKINWLKSLTMNDGYSGKYRNVKIVFGDLFKNQVWVIKSVNPKMSHFSAADKWLPIRAAVQVEFMLDPEKNRYIEDVRNGK